jgi:2,3-bisphosphoglycerate-dependent phosphoglycerate mutase
MELVLVRHALPVRRELVEGPADPELSEDGTAQARLLADYLASEDIDAVYSSPLRRAVQTAEPLAGHLGRPIALEDGIAEWDRNASEYIPVEEMKAQNHPRWQAMLRGEWDGQDESPDEFASRVVGTVERLIESHPSQRIVLVCHGGVINAYLAHVLGLAASPGFFYPNYTSIHRVAAARPGQRMLVTLNETTHLRGTGLPIGLYQK